MLLRLRGTHLRRQVLAAILVILMAPPVGAKTPAGNDAQRWQALKAQAEEAFRRGDYAEGVKPAKEALDLSREAFGKRGQQTLTSLNELAILYQALGRYREAEPLYVEALQATRDILGPRHPDTLTTLDNLAVLYKDLGRYSEAERSHLEALQARREVLGPRHPDTLTSLDNLALLYKEQGRYREAEPLNREALRLRREVLGPRDPDTLQSLNSLGSLYQDQGRHDDAEPLFQEALEARREVLGPRHPDTLISLSNLALLYKMQGRHSEAEPLYREALQTKREVLGPRHPETLTSIDNLALLCHAQGRYGEAEALSREALQAWREVAGPRHPDTLISLNNLALLYQAQGRYGDAEPLWRESLQSSREVLGPRHPNTLQNLNNLALLYKKQGRYSEAEPLYREALQTKREVLGPRHPDTLISLHNMATLYHAQGRDGEAEPLYRQALEASGETLGPRHPQTLATLNNLAELYRDQRRYGEAEPLYRQALKASGETLGPRHPQTLATQLNMVRLLVSLDRRAEAVEALRQMEPNLLGWIGQELYSTESGAVRSQMVSSHARFQDVVLSLATTAGDSDARRLAAALMLHFKVLQGEEEAWLAHLARRSLDRRVQKLANDISRLRAALASAAQGAPDAFEKTLQALEAKRREMIDASPDYKNRLRAQDASLDDVRKALPPGAILIEFRQFRPLDFRTGTLGEPRFAGLLLTSSGEPVVADLGPVSEVQLLAQVLTKAPGSAPAGAGRRAEPDPAGAPLPPDDQTAEKLCERLFAPFKDAVDAATTVYVAPDGILNLVPFARLQLPDGRYWFERQEVRTLQTGRDLLRPAADHPAHGMLALGGVDFGAALAAAETQDSMFFNAARSDRSAAVRGASETFRAGFKPLPATAEEVNDVMVSYVTHYPGEPAEIWSGAEASKARLMDLKSPPRVLHLATHGFYRSNASREPMLLSGIALAGANRELAGTGKDGLLFALEAEGLNLDGTELVVLSACDTAQGSIDYSEGVFGLARALRTAGARNVLVTLWPLEDGMARDFMVDFYKNWIGQQTYSDPAKALRQTQLDWIRYKDRRDPRVWAPYVVVE
jgi:CHAT domain-containing protein/tetratricopeptide (TPR) repeat protein